MSEILQEKDRKARKEHRCSYCGETIKKGEIYEYAKLKEDGKLYEWKNHKKCGFVARELWKFADPDDGMTEDDFYDACVLFCRKFVCPSCPNIDTSYDEMDCIKDKSYCIDKIYDVLQIYELYKDRRDGWFNVWKLRKRKQEEKEYDA